MVNLNPFTPSLTASSTITELRVYPVKSCRGISLQRWHLTRQGLDLDRNWMFVDRTTNKFVTIRQVSELTLINTALRDDEDGELQLVLSVRNKPHAQVHIPARPSRAWLAANTSLEEVDIWGIKTDGWVYGEPVNHVFAEELQRPVALVYKGPTPRILRGNGHPSLLGREESTNFPDLLPLLIANLQSLDELNRRLAGKQELMIEMFRPNVIVAGDEQHMPAWSEDNWSLVRIVDVPPEKRGLFSSWAPSTLQLDVVARCARCQVPNVDPDTAVKDVKEPWNTLVAYRRIDTGIKYKPCFGMLACPREEGEIGVGMRLEVLQTTAAHVYKQGF